MKITVVLLNLLLHISEVSWDRLDKVTDEINLGDTFDVKYFGIDPKTRKPRVSRKALLPRPERSDRPQRKDRPERRDRSDRNDKSKG